MVYKHDELDHVDWVMDVIHVLAKHPGRSLLFRRGADNAAPLKYSLEGNERDAIDVFVTEINASRLSRPWPGADPPDVHRSACRARSPARERTARTRPSRSVFLEAS